MLFFVITEVLNALQIWCGAFFRATEDGGQFGVIGEDECMAISHLSGGFVGDV